MNPDQINAAIARLCGWIPTKHKVEYDGGWEVEETRWSYPGKGGGHYYVPDYAKDLNACAEFERTIKDKSDQDRYTSYLLQDLYYHSDSIPTIDDCAWVCCVSTPIQRCEAFLRLREKPLEAWNRENKDLPDCFVARQDQFLQGKAAEWLWTRAQKYKERWPRIKTGQCQAEAALDLVAWQRRKTVEETLGWLVDWEGKV